MPDYIKFEDCGKSALSKKAFEIAALQLKKGIGDQTGRTKRCTPHYRLRACNNWGIYDNFV